MKKAYFRLRMTEEDLARLKTVAKSKGMTASQWIRKAIATEAGVVSYPADLFEDMQKLFAQTTRLQSNINQIASHLNSEAIMGDAEYLKQKDIDKINEALAELRPKVLSIKQTLKQIAFEVRDGQ